MVITIDVNSHLSKKVMDFIGQLEGVRVVKRENYYIDDLGDLIEIRNGKEYIVPTKEDIEAFQESKEDFISLEELKKSLNV